MNNTPYHMAGIDVSACVQSLMRDGQLTQSEVLQKAGVKALFQLNELPVEVLSLLTTPVKRTSLHTSFSSLA